MTVLERIKGYVGYIDDSLLPNIDIWTQDILGDTSRLVVGTKPDEVWQFSKEYRGIKPDVDTGRLLYNDSPVEALKVLDVVLNRGVRQKRRAHPSVASKRVLLDDRTSTYYAGELTPAWYILNGAACFAPKNIPDNYNVDIIFYDGIPVKDKDKYYDCDAFESFHNIYLPLVILGVSSRVIANKLMHLTLPAVFNFDISFPTMAAIGEEEGDVSYWDIPDLSGEVDDDDILNSPPTFALNLTDGDGVDLVTSFTDDIIESLDDYYDDEDIELLTAKMSEIGARMQDYSQKVQVATSQFSADNVEFQAKLQIALQELNTKDAVILQEWGAKFQKYTQRLTNWSTQFQNALQLNQQKWLEYKEELGKLNRQNEVIRVLYQDALTTHGLGIQQPQGA